MEEIVKPVEINPTQSNVEKIETQGEPSAPSYEIYETPTEEQKKMNMMKSVNRFLQN